MKMKKKLLALSLAGAMTVGLLAGCNTGPKVDPDDLAYQAAGISRDTVMYTMDGVDVTADEYLFWVLNSISGQQQTGGLADDAAWAGEIEGQPVADYLKNEALEASKFYTMIIKRATDAGLTISEEDKAMMDAQMEQLDAFLAMQGITFQDYLKSLCITEATFTKLNEVYFLNTALMAKLQEPGGALETTPEQIQAFMDEKGMYVAKHILLSTQNSDGTNFSEEEKAAVKAKADAMVAELRAATDLESAFDEKMNTESQDPGLAQAPNGYLAYKSQMVPEFETAALALAPGEMSDAVESTFGYHIIYRVDPANSDDAKTAYANATLATLLDTWLSEAEVTTTDAFTALDPKAFYDKVNEMNEARQAEREAAAAATATPAPTGTPEETTAPTGTPAVG